MRSRFRSLVVLAVVVAGAVTARAQSGSVRTSTGTAAAHASVGDITGTVWRADGTPLPDARLRLRQVQTGRIVATTRADRDGRFAFDRRPEGQYLVELVSNDDRVLAVSPLFRVTPPEAVTTYVRLPGKRPWFAGFFGNAAIAAIATASALGIAAVGSNGLPASPQ